MPLVLRPFCWRRFWLHPDLPRIILVGCCSRESNTLRYSLVEWSPDALVSATSAFLSAALCEMDENLGHFSEFKAVSGARMCVSRLRVQRLLMALANLSLPDTYHGFDCFFVAATPMQSCKHNWIPVFQQWKRLKSATIRCPDTTGTMSKQIYDE